MKNAFAPVNGMAAFRVRSEACIAAAAVTAAAYDNVGAPDGFRTRMVAAVTANRPIGSRVRLPFPPQGPIYSRHRAGVDRQQGKY